MIIDISKSEDLRYYIQREDGKYLSCFVDDQPWFTGFRLGAACFSLKEINETFKRLEAAGITNMKAGQFLAKVESLR